MELLERVRDIFTGKPLQNTQRILILVALYLSKRLGFTDLVKVTGIDKGRMACHLEVLEKHGLVKKKKYIMLLGPRTYIEITKEGEETLENILKALDRIITIQTR